MATETEHGFYYAATDYIGVGRRFAIDLIDAFVAVLVSIVASVVVFMILPSAIVPGMVFAAWVVVWISYFVALKRSLRFRTLGYVVTGAEIVSLHGKRPSAAALLLRLFFALFGPLNLLFDLFWIPSDSGRQALRDKFAHTYVIRRGAVPAGSGPIVYSHYTILGGSFIFPEVKQGSTIL
jgi:uncharacterized RDD family membrane protein YckC